ncbi:sugar kinase [Halorientalis marina]|uniref:sugar kinase n=1 Tax=Halorientalis marina TaxID=2931976 RepID=UPI001FF5389A|nr:sugar kinase [Halorientalis marina]
MTDLVTFGETALRLSPPRDSRLETVDTFDAWAAGAASSVAVAASRLGTDTTWTSKMADTPLGRRVVGELRSHGLTTAVTWTEGGDYRQGLTFYEGGETPRENVVIDDRHGTAIETVEPGDLPMERIQDAEAVFLSGETLALSETVVDTANAVLRASGGTSVLGMDYRPDLWDRDEARETLEAVFPAVDVLVVNDDDAGRVLKKQGKPREIAHAVASEYDFETVVITRGEHGALAWHDATIHEREAVETTGVDRTGQHDAFTGAFLGRRLAGESIGTALSHGVAAAALARTIPGPVPTISPDEVESTAADIGGSSPGAPSGGIR